MNGSSNKKSVSQFAAHAYKTPRTGSLALLVQAAWESAATFAVLK
jgi:hypothetical protein